ncbi:MAG: CopG family transcriptional regulator [Thermoprotei archaeon]|nr:MAG: CopG family transcriptional regulator [Thermoprotei archaeon]
MIVVTFHIPENQLETLDNLVRERGYTSRSEAIRIALREFLDKYIKQYRINVD